MRHTISPSEVTAIRKAQAAQAKAAQAAKEKAELDRHQSAMELRYKTQ